MHLVLVWPVSKALLHPPCCSFLGASLLHPLPASAQVMMQPAFNTSSHYRLEHPARRELTGPAAIAQLGVAIDLGGSGDSLVRQEWQGFPGESQSLNADPGLCCSLQLSNRFDDLEHAAALGSASGAARYGCSAPAATAPATYAADPAGIFIPTLHAEAGLQHYGRR